LVITSDPNGESNKDTSFVLGFFGINAAQDSQQDANLYIGTNDPRGAEVIVDTPNITIAGFPRTISIPPGVTETVAFPTVGDEDIRVNTPGSRNRAITVKSVNNAKLSVIGVNDQSQSTDGFLGLPCKSIRAADGSTNIVEYKYFVFSSGSTVEIDFNSRILIIPCEEVVGEVTIKQPEDTVTRVNLRKYETFLFQRSSMPDPNDSSRNIPIDLTGTVITSRTPLSVFVGHECGQVPTQSTACDHLVEQIPPHAVYGKMFFPVPFALRQSGDIFKIGSVADDNEVNVTCTRRTASGESSMVSSSAVIDEGEYHTHRTYSRSDVPGDDYFRDFCCIETSEPATVMQYMLGHSEDELNINGIRDAGDPSITIVPPVSQFSNDYIINTFDDVLQGTSETEYMSYMSWAIPAAFFDPETSDRNNFEVNGVAYTPPGQSVAGSGDYIPIKCKNGSICGYGAFGPIPAGNSTISYKSSRDPLATVYASVYGYQTEHSYAYPAGFECTPLGRELS
jgi:hypothetical protein